MGKFRGTDSDPGWINRRFAQLERMIRESAAAKKLQAATIGFGGLWVKDGGSVNVEGGGKITLWGTGVVGTMQDGSFGMATVDVDGNITTPSFLTQVDGFLADAGPGKGYAVYRVDAATGKAVVSSSVGEVMLSYSSTSAGANTRILLDGTIQMSTSSRRYKQDITDADIDPATVLDLRARSWRDKTEVEADPNTEQRYVGFIAEELDELGLTEFVEYDEQDRPNAIAYDRLSVALLAVVKDLDSRLSRLEQ